MHTHSAIKSKMSRSVLQFCWTPFIQQDLCHGAMQLLHTGQPGLQAGRLLPELLADSSILGLRTRCS